ncbi:hypothetical protein SLE2022_325440 [Rubroshorea leprosula]
MKIREAQSSQLTSPSCKLKQHHHSDFVLFHRLDAGSPSDHDRVCPIDGCDLLLSACATAGIVFTTVTVD